ncbi:hypothetical protein L6164_026006 [Bauhinia variegata]|uniref:Uncharacterized protein n=1 Tax=Bauhinia variegata TaxID=167791 RepID=A0ACB9M4A2_BAUVA|nr:hypothetical protein L6164_026006 [Bauhinia variegata]
MASISQFCFYLLLASAVLCFAVDITQGENSTIDIEDYGGTGPNPKHDPGHSPSPPGESIPGTEKRVMDGKINDHLL